MISLTIDLHPISRVFRRGNRIRMAITGADAGNALTPIVEPPPVITVHRQQRHASHVVLPVILPGWRR
jgi:predicted acyl esterase